MSKADDAAKIDAYRKQAANTLAHLRAQRHELETALAAAVRLYSRGTDQESEVLTDIENMRHANGHLADAIEAVRLLSE